MISAVLATISMAREMDEEGGINEQDVSGAKAMAQDMKEKIEDRDKTKSGGGSGSSSSSGGGDGGGYDRSDMTCFKCQQLGHFAADCRNEQVHATSSTDRSKSSSRQSERSTSNTEFTVRP